MLEFSHPTMIPSYAIIPLLLAAFVLLAADHYMLNPVHTVRNLRFIMMFGAVLLIVAELFASNFYPWLSLPLFGLALLWLAIAGTLFWRRMSAQ